MKKDLNLLGNQFSQNRNLKKTDNFLKVVENQNIIDEKIIYIQTN